MDAASGAGAGAGGDWGRDPDGDDGYAGDVRLKVPSVAMPGVVIA